MTRKDIILPLFKYLCESYDGNFFHMVDGSFYRINILPEDNFKMAKDIQKVYNKLNVLLLLEGYRLTISNEMASISYEYAGDKYSLNLPIEVLHVYNGEETVLRPVINSITVKREGLSMVFHINLDFSEIIDKLDTLIKNKSTICRL